MQVTVVRQSEPLSAPPPTQQTAQGGGVRFWHFVALYVACILYSIVRYVVFAPQNLQNLPVFVLNKGISMGAAFCFALAFWHGWRNRKAKSRSGDLSTRTDTRTDKKTLHDPSAWLRAGVFGSVSHIPMSLVILTPAYFKEFFAGERLSFHGEAVFLFGALTAGGIYLVTRASWTAMQRWWLSLGTVAVLFSHTLFMGLARGLNITRSHAYLPPMWLLSLIGTALGIAFLLLSRPDESDESSHCEVSQ